MNNLKTLVSKTLKNVSKEKRKKDYGSFQTGALGQFNNPSIVDILVPNKNVKDITLRDTFKATDMLAEEIVYFDEKLVCLTIRNEEPSVKNIDIVEEFIGDELEEFYNECACLEEKIRKVKIPKAITNYLFKTWRDNIESLDHKVPEENQP